MSAKGKEVADLKTKNDHLKKEMEVLSLLPAPKSEQKKLSLPDRTGISGNYTVDGEICWSRRQLRFMLSTTRLNSGRGI